MEAENQHLKQALAQKQSQVKTLESRLTSTQLDLQESQEKVTLHACYVVSSVWPADMPKEWTCSAEILC